jgi:hypothetical protein
VTSHPYQSRPEGEYASCARNGYGPDAWLPATSEFFPTQYGRLRFDRCRTCRSEVLERRFGFVYLEKVA